MISVYDASGGASLSIRVHPRAKKNAITGETGDALKVSLPRLPPTAVPTKAALNSLQNF
jgi:uncharacterized protein YggU (UPF0235/DUF167 family)